MLSVSNAYAQPQQQQQNGNRACPEGFELNKGKCQAEPTILAGECPDSLGTVDVIVDINGYCETANTFTSTLFVNACNEANGVIVDAGTQPGVVHCAFNVPGETICENGGILNEASGLCQIKPGNRA